MAMFRSIPYEVEAVQFVGMKDGEPVLKEMGASIPAWLWKGITKVVVVFKETGIAVHGNGINAGDWIVFDGVFIGHCDDEKFQRTFVRARKPISEMLSAEKFTGRKKSKGASIPDPDPVGDVNEERLVQSDGHPGMTGVLPEDTIPDISVAVIATTGATAFSKNSPAADQQAVDAIIDQFMNSK